MLVEALNIIINDKGRKDIRAIMISTGEKDYTKLICEKIDEYNLKEFITFFEWTNYKTPEFMSKCDAYADTMYRDTPGQGAGKTMLEAMASGIPVVVPDNPDMKVYIKNMENGILYKGANPQSLANALIGLMSNKKLASKLSINGRKFVLSKFDWSKNMKIMKKKYLDIYKK